MSAPAVLTKTRYKTISKRRIPLPSFTPPASLLNSQIPIMNDLEKNVNSTPEPITLTWLDLTFEVKGKVILDGVSGQLGSGQLLAVMGPSGAFRLLDIIATSLLEAGLGAGKSTFLDVSHDHFSKSFLVTPSQVLCKRAKASKGTVSL